MLQLAEHLDEAVGIAAMEADARFVEDVERTYQAASQRSGQVDALALTARERVAQSVQGEVSQAHIFEELDAAVYLGQDAVRYGGIVLVQLEVQKELLEVVDRQVYQFGDGASAYLHVAGFLLQTGAVAGWAHGLSAVAGQHYAVLNLVLVLFQHLEEGVYAHFFARSVPQVVLLLLGKLIVRGEDGEVVRRSLAEELLQPFAHFLATPAHHGSIVYGEGAVGDDQLLVDAYHTAKALALGAGTDG